MSRLRIPGLQHIQHQTPAHPTSDTEYDGSHETRNGTSHLSKTSAVVSRHPDHAASLGPGPVPVVSPVSTPDLSRALGRPPTPPPPPSADPSGPTDLGAAGPDRGPDVLLCLS